jgi:hypothetical protein
VPRRRRVQARLQLPPSGLQRAHQRTLRQSQESQASGARKAMRQGPMGCGSRIGAHT